MAGLAHGVSVSGVAVLPDGRLLSVAGEASTSGQDEVALWGDGDPRSSVQIEPIVPQFKGESYYPSLLTVNARGDRALIVISGKGAEVWGLPAFGH